MVSQPTQTYPIAGKDYHLNLPKGHLSHSQIDCYMKCPEQYRRKYILGEKSLYSVYLAEGQAFHKLMESTNLCKLHEGKHLNRRAAVLHYKACHEKEMDKVEDWSGGTAKQVMERGLKFITHIWRGKDGPIDKPVMWKGKPGVEWPYKIKICGVPVIGFVDIVEEFCCVDYKVAAEARRYDPEWSVQGLLYRIATGLERFTFQVCEKRTNRCVQISDKTSLDLITHRVNLIVSKVAQAISLGSFPVTNPTINSLCSEKWCSFWGDCLGAEGVRS